MMVLTADFGGTTIKLGLVDGDQVLEQARVKAEPSQRLEPRLPGLQSEWVDLCDRAGLSVGAVDGLALAFPSLLNRARTRITPIPDKYPDADEIDWMRWSRETIGCPVVLEHDVVAALLGECHFGAGRGSDHVVMLTLGTGVGSAVIQNGRVLRGAHGAAGVLGGHMTINVDGDRCVCGNVGCVETQASTWVLQEQQGADADLAWLFEEEPPGREALRERVLRGWGAAVVNLVHAYDPARIVVGGGAMQSQDQILPALRSYVARHAWRPHTADSLSIVSGELGDRAALLGLAQRFRRGLQPTNETE